MGDQDIFLFQGGDDGYGDSLDRGRNSYNWAYNWDFTPVGTSAPVPSPLRKTIISAASWPQAPITAAFEWRDTNNLPRVHWATGRGSTSAQAIRLTPDNTIGITDTGVDPFTKAVLYRNDGSDADAEVAWYCNGSGNDNLFEQLKDNTFRNASHDIKFDGLAVVGSDLWGWQGYKVRKLTTDSDPGLAASWGVAIPVGLPSYDVNNIIVLGDSPIVIKGDGAFVFNKRTGDFAPLTPAVTPHPSNGLASFTDGRGRIYYDTVQGDLLVITFGFQSQQGPARTATINRDTPWGRITAMTADMEHIYAAIEPGATRTQSISGFKVVLEDGGVFTDETDAATDGDETDIIDIGLLSITAPDRIWVGADEPFHGAYFEMQPGSTRTSDQAAIMVISYGLSGGTYQDAFATHLAVLGSHDGTSQFSKDGLITMQDSDSGDLPNLSSNPWTKTTIDSGGLNFERYWMRITPSSSTALTGAKIMSVSLVPYRPPLGNQGNFPRLAYALSSALPKILVGTWRGEEIIWQDTWTLDSPEIEQLVVTQTRAFETQDTRRSLMAISREGYTLMQIGADGSALRQPYADFGTGGSTLPLEHAIGFSGRDFGWPTHKKTVSGMVIHMPHLQPEDEVYLWYWWDDDADRTYEHGPFTDGTSVIVVPELEGEGRVLYCALGWLDKATNPINPQLPTVEIPQEMWQLVEPIDSTRKPAIASPMGR